MKHLRGFSLIELMIVIAIIAILAAIAAPAYQVYAVRAKLIEGIAAIGEAKTIVASNFQSGGMAKMARSADIFNDESTQSKYVEQITIDPATGAITIIYSANSENGLPEDMDGKTIVYTPQISELGTFVPLADGADGKVDWACASAAHTNADGRGMLSTAGTLPAKYAPAECR